MFLRKTLIKKSNILCLVALTTKQLHCPPQVRIHGARDYMEVNGRCYEFNMDPQKNWPDAEHDCITRGGHLVSIGSMAEQHVVYNALRVSIGFDCVRKKR